MSCCERAQPLLINSLRVSYIHAKKSFSARQVGEGNEDAGMDDDEEEGDEEEGGEGVAVEDMAMATFKGHSDAVYCVAVNPKVSSQVRVACYTPGIYIYSRLKKLALQQDIL